VAETVVCGRENCPLNLRGAAAVWVSGGSAVAEMNGAAIHIYIDSQSFVLWRCNTLLTSDMVVE